MRAIGAARSVSARHGTSAGRSRRHAPASTSATMSQRQSVDAHAVPTGPSAGSPASPKMSAQFSAAFATFATTIVTTIARVRPIACRL